MAGTEVGSTLGASSWLMQRTVSLERS